MSSLTSRKVHVGLVHLLLAAEDAQLLLPGRGNKILVLSNTCRDKESLWCCVGKVEGGVGFGVQDAQRFLRYWGEGRGRVGVDKRVVLRKEGRTDADKGHLGEGPRLGGTGNGREEKGCVYGMRCSCVDKLGLCVGGEEEGVALA